VCVRERVERDGERGERGRGKGREGMMGVAEGECEREKERNVGNVVYF
jgi:hypothetical protein